MILLVRKKGKLPGACASLEYSLEYGQDRIEIQKVMEQAVQWKAERMIMTTTFV